jgi:hypothetical protein
MARLESDNPYSSKKQRPSRTKGSFLAFCPDLGFFFLCFFSLKTDTRTGGSSWVGGRWKANWARCARAGAAVVVVAGAARSGGAAGRSEGASVAAWHRRGRPACALAPRSLAGRSPRVGGRFGSSWARYAHAGVADAGKTGVARGGGAAGRGERASASAPRRRCPRSGSRPRRLDNRPSAAAQLHGVAPRQGTLSVGPTGKTEGRAAQTKRRRLAGRRGAWSRARISTRGRGSGGGGSPRAGGRWRASWVRRARSGAADVVVAGAARGGGVAAAWRACRKARTSAPLRTSGSRRPSVGGKSVLSAATLLVSVLRQQGSTSCGPEHDAQATLSFVLTLWGGGAVGQPVRARAPCGFWCGSLRVGNRYRSVRARCARAGVTVVVVTAELRH